MTEAVIRAYIQFAKNEWTYSEDYTQADWTKTNITVDAILTTGPTGTSVASIVYETAATGNHGISRTITATDDKVQALSFYAKAIAGGRTKIQVSLTDKSGGSQAVDINLSTGVSSVCTMQSIGITACGSGWYRIKVTADAKSGGTTPTFKVLFYSGSDLSYAGDTDAGVAIWGFQHQKDQNWHALYTRTTTAAKPAYTEVTSYLFSAEWSDGRAYSNTLGRTSAGSMSIELDNSDYRFSKYYPSGPYYGHILPRRLIYLMGNDGTTDYSLACGYLESASEYVAVGDRRAVRINGNGPLSYYEGVNVSLAIQTDKRTDEIVNLILVDAEADWRTWGTLEQGDVVVSKYWLDGATALNALREMEATEYGLITEMVTITISNTAEYAWGGPGIHFFSRDYWDVPPAVAATFSDVMGSSGTLGYYRIQVEDNFTDIANIVTCDVAPYVSGSVSELWRCSDVPSIATGATLTLWANYSPAVESWNTPTATTDYTANTAADGSGTDKTAQVSVVATKFSSSMQLAFTNADAGTVYLTLARATGTPIVESNKTVVKAEDTASQEKYGGKFPFKVDAKWIPDVATAQTYVNKIIARTADPSPNVTLSIAANASQAHLTAALSLGLGSYCTVTATSVAQMGISGNYWLARRSFRAVSNLEVYVDYTFSSSPTVCAGATALAESLAPSTATPIPSTPAPEMSGCVTLSVVAGAVDTDATRGKVFYIESGSSDFVLNNPTNFTVCGTPILWVIVGTGTVTVGSKFNARGNVFDLSGGRDYLGGIYNGAFDRIDLFWNTDPNGGSRSSSASASSSSTPSISASISASMSSSASAS